MDIDDRLSESPDMAAEINGGVLPFAVKVIGGRIDDPGAELLGSGAVDVDVGHAHHDGMAGVGCQLRGLRFWNDALFGHDDGAATVSELDAVVSDP